ncbi:serine protein kinase RIO [Candidatus Woesearchaeota archaeon]|nr:serine protein kinase RIO [Candidatus Woesearchaeota archaeon]MBW3022131.1 serine protein kinase RIO [Candidatus Woesearchaeota archaeon]
MAKISREKWKIYQNVFDEFTLRTLFKLSSQGHFIELKSPISIGKESNVFSATTHNGLIIVKIYRLESCDFNRMYDYIKQDPRYLGLRKHKRKIVFAWTQREFRNIMKAREASVHVPKPIAFLNNVLLEEFIGDKTPAPRLKDVELKNLKSFFNNVVSNMKKLYRAGLVHADLSGFNILNYKNNPVFIDFSQATQTNAPNSEELLLRDVKNVCVFFTKRGLKTDINKVLKEIKS